MSTFVEERRGSGDFTSSSGKIMYVVFGADDQSSAEAAALADPAAQEQYGAFFMDDIDVQDQGNGIFYVDLSYKRKVPSDASTTSPNTTNGSPGTTPGSARPSPEGSKPEHEPSQPLPRDVSFTMGGETRHITQAIETTYRIAKDGDEAPDFFGLIGYDRKTGEVHGCDVYAGVSDFTITKRFEQLTIGWFRHCLDLVATLNSAPFLGTDIQETLFLGVDGQYKAGEKIGSREVPWTATARFKYGRKRANVPIDALSVDDAELVVPLICPFDYVQVMSKEEKESYLIEGVSTPVMVERPQYVLVYRVYQLDSEAVEGASFYDLGFN